jgi:hypothetical protein
MKRYVIERDIPKVGNPSREEYRVLAANITKFAGKMIAGFPVTKVTEVPFEIGPMTAYSN